MVYFLEKMSPEYSGISLNDLVIKSLDLFSLDSEKDVFIKKATTRGYTYNSYYDSFVYSVDGYAKYTVTDDFPKLTKHNVPTGIEKAKYDILLASIKEFQNG